MRHLIILVLIIISFSASAQSVYGKYQDTERSRKFAEYQNSLWLRKDSTFTYTLYGIHGIKKINTGKYIIINESKIILNPTTKNKTAYLFKEGVLYKSKFYQIMNKPALWRSSSRF